MLTMDQIRRVRELFYQGGESITEIARQEGLSWKTVRKYIDMEDFTPPKPKLEASSRQKGPSKLKPYEPRIDEWLTADKQVKNRKQRHTAKRVFNRLQEEVEGFDCSYRLVARYVAKKKEELKLKTREKYIPLEHKPGEAQADFGAAEFCENSIHRDGKYFVLSFPFSNGGYLQLAYGENLECLLESMKAIFEYMKGVPTEIWFDNASSIVTKIIKGGERGLSERFLRFQIHYGFQPIFMNPASGWEKGNVENKVGYCRRNLLVPVPEFVSINDFNQHLLLRCDEDMGREHYLHSNETIKERFQKDLGMLRPLPSTEFDTADYQPVKTNKYGKFTLNAGLHEYSVSPEYASTTVIVKISSSEVIVLDSTYKEILRHRRLYGKHKEKLQSMQWLPYLKYIALKPRALRNSGIYEMLPEQLQKYLTDCSNSERGKILKVISDFADRTGFDSAVKTVEQAMHYNAIDADSLRSLYLRTYSDIPELPPIKMSGNIPQLEPMGVNLESYDNLLKGSCNNA